jgi:hypothetical protein
MDLPILSPDYITILDDDLHLNSAWGQLQHNLHPFGAVCSAGAESDIRLAHKGGGLCRAGTFAPVEGLFWNGFGYVCSVIYGAQCLSSYPVSFHDSR